MWSATIPVVPNLCWHLFPALALLVDYLVFSGPFSQRIKAPYVAVIVTVTYVYVPTSSFPYHHPFFLCSLLLLFSLHIPLF